MDLEVIDLNEENPEVTTCPRKSVVSGLPKEFENSGNDSGLSVLKWLENIINEYNNENIKLYEKELIRDKNQMSIKSVRDLEDGFVIGLAVRVRLPKHLCCTDSGFSSQRYQDTNFLF